MKRSTATLVTGIFALLMATGICAENAVDPIIAEARLKAASGDLEAATALYHQAVQVDSKNTEARHELAKVLVEAQVQDPHSDSSEALNVIGQDAEDDG